MTSFWDKFRDLFRQQKSSAESIEPQQQTGDHADAYWQQVYNARVAYYQQHFGELPEDILKIGHMFGVWPGGGLFVIPASKIANGLFAYTTFGFSNPDMPAKIGVEDVATEKDELGRVTKTQTTLKAKSPATSPDSAAGYGYEFMVLADEHAEWPLWILQWACNAELLNDVEFLQRVEKYEGITVEDVKIGDDNYVHLFINKAQNPLPTGTNLPNGNMQLLIATVITQEEMHWSMQNSRPALLDALMRSNVGQISVLNRNSIVHLDTQD